MSDNQPNYRGFHPLVANAYIRVHQWIEENLEDANGYKSIPYSNLKQKLQQTDWKHIAFQYYALFPAHYFKAAHILETEIGKERLINWLRHKQKICVLDIGCGAGAGSAAFVEAILCLKEQGNLTNDINIFFIGVDPNHRAIGLYCKMMTQLQELSKTLINIDFDWLDTGYPEATLDIKNILKEELRNMNLPCLSNVLVMQLNVISPFSQNHKTRQARDEELLALGIRKKQKFQNSIELGFYEAKAYKELLEDVPIDAMHIVTIGTKNMEKHVQLGTNSEITLEERIKDMAATLRKVIGSRHTINQVHSDHHIVYFKNPISCYWRDKNRIQYHTDFYVDFQTVYSADRAEDKEWNETIDIDNLRLAWARARNNLVREILCDETELRLFEIDLDVKLEELKEQLCAYASDVARTDETISYKVPKNSSSSRPKGLSRIEEEILSVAIIQKLGDKASRLKGSSYAYRISGKSDFRDTEYLYEYWFSAYCYYMRKVQESASMYLNGAILRVDIELFYTKIIQEKLCNELSRELTVSDRIRWLIRLLLSKNIDEHELGKGLTQGNLSSGFYANIYLTSIDARFGSGNEWGVEFHRYVDDMIIIIPNPEDMELVESALKDELQELGLNLNETKTERIYKVTSFLEQSDEDEVLERLSDRFESIVNPLWILNSEHRATLTSSYHKDELWWHNIESYQQCLESIRIHASETYLSRKVYKYLFNRKSRERDLSKQKEIFELEGELKYTEPPNNDSLNAIPQWSSSFTSSNNIWVKYKNEVRRELVSLFQDSWEAIGKLNESHPTKNRTLEKYIRFALYRLSILGFEDILGSLTKILREAFWIIRDPLNLLESLAQQGYCTEIRSLLIYYQNLTEPVEYLKAITIRSMRFLPEVNDREWKLIVEFSTLLDESISLAEKLMATETWLYLGHKYNNFKKSQHIEAVKNALNSDPPPPNRLKKNYLLILGQFEPNSVNEFSVNSNDRMLVSAKDLALQGNPSAIFDLPEPKILRENYYSGKTQTESEEKSY